MLICDQSTLWTELDKNFLKNHEVISKLIDQLQLYDNELESIF